MGRGIEECMCVGVGNKVWGEAGFAMLGLEGMVVGHIWSKWTSFDGLRDPTFSPKARLEHQGHSTLRSLGLWIRTRPMHWQPQHSLALELEHLSR